MISERELNHIIEALKNAIPYAENGMINVSVEATNEIIEMLKEQDPLKPIYSEKKFGDFLPYCPVCKKVLPSVSQYGKSNFCYNCGQEVKWND